MIHAPDFRLIQQLCQAAVLLLVATISTAWWRRASAAKPARIRVEKERRPGTKH